ncbi:MAG: hypothetical protein LC687_03805, partial [Actinobacteria bacterium]|nr:hypothetical protein [Actinomycetota bacterium]
MADMQRLLRVLALACVLACLATAQNSGIISSSVIQSCVDASPTMECTDEGKATRVEAFLPVGGEQQLEFAMLYPRSELGPSALTERCATTTESGVCMVSRRISVNSRASEVTMGYSLTGRNLDIPFGYAPHETMAYKQVKDREPTCQGYSEAYFPDPESDDTKAFNLIMRLEERTVGKYFDWVDDNAGIKGIWDTYNNRDDLDDMIVSQSDDDDDDEQRGFIFMEYPSITSTAVDGDQKVGNYRASNGVTLGSDDEDRKYAIERKTQCNMGNVFNGNIQYPQNYKFNESSLGGYDDDDDDDSCQSVEDEDDENVSGGSICEALTSAQCMQSLTVTARRRLACSACREGT